MHEIACAPAAVLVPARRLLQQVIYLCKNNADPAHVTVFFFCVRLVSRIESFAHAVLGLPSDHRCGPTVGLRGAVEELAAGLRGVLDDDCSPVFAFFMQDAVSRRDNKLRSAVFAHQVIAASGCPLQAMDSVQVGRCVGAAVAFGNWHVPGQQVLRSLRIPARLKLVNGTMRTADVGELDVRDAEPKYLRRGIFAAEGDVFEALHRVMPRIMSWLAVASCTDRQEALTIALRVILENDKVQFGLVPGEGAASEDARLDALQKALGADPEAAWGLRATLRAAGGDVEAARDAVAHGHGTPAILGRGSSAFDLA